MWSMSWLLDIYSTISYKLCMDLFKNVVYIYSALYVIVMEFNQSIVNICIVHAQSSESQWICVTFLT